MHSELDMKVKCDKNEVLATLRENRQKHSKIVEEARKGYVEKARKALTERMKELEKGKITPLRFDLVVPLDYTKTYNTAILMLECHQDASIVLTATEFRNLIQDQWDWSRSFYVSNSAYSGTAAAVADEANDENY